MATHSTTAWEIPWTEEPGVPPSMGLQESNTTERLNNNLIHGTETLPSSIVFHSPNLDILKSCRSWMTTVNL